MEQSDRVFWTAQERRRVLHAMVDVLGELHPQALTTSTQKIYHTKELLGLAEERANIPADRRRSARQYSIAQVLGHGWLDKVRRINNQSQRAKANVGGAAVVKAKANGGETHVTPKAPSDQPLLRAIASLEQRVLYLEMVLAQV